MFPYAYVPHHKINKQEKVSENMIDYTSEFSLANIQHATPACPRDVEPGFFAEKSARPSRLQPTATHCYTPGPLVQRNTLRDSIPTPH